MARGNQRENDRKKNEKNKKAQEKTKNTMTGSEYQRAREDTAERMRQKQKLADERKAAGLVPPKKK